MFNNSKRDNFLPPNNLLEEIGFDNKTEIELVFPSYQKKYDGVIPLKALSGAIQEYYHNATDESRCYQVGLMVAEAIDNACRHGNRLDRRKNVHIKIWLGEKGILFGIRDEGSFYTKFKNKQIVEKKQKVEPPKNDKMKHNGYGMGFIYKGANSIFVDCQNNTLYLTASVGKRCLDY